MIKTEHLNYGYDSHSAVLKDITLTLPEGHIYGLLGKNGVGKSTLLKLLAGSLLSKSEYTVGDEHPAKRTVAFQQSIRLIPENEAIPDTKIEDLAKVVAPLYPTFSWEIFEKAMEEFEVPRQKKLTTLSLGQQKKALISLSIACNTPYMLMDEPTNGMDIPSKSSFRRLMASIVDERRTVLISTHQIDDLDGLIDHLIILENNGVLLNESLQTIGTKLCFGPATEDDEVIYTEPTLKGDWSVMINKTGEEMPVDTKLLFSAVVKHPDVFKRIFTANNNPNE